MSSTYREKVERKLHLFLCGPQDIQSGARAKAILDLAGPHAQMEWNALFCQPRHDNVMFKDVLDNVHLQGNCPALQQQC
jgi:hypothetical protein